MTQQRSNIFDKALLAKAGRESLYKLSPKKLWRNPVMLIVAVCAAIVSISLIESLASGQDYAFLLQLALWLWFTLLFANFAEAFAEGRGKAQADTLRKTKSELMANKLGADGRVELVAAAQLLPGDMVVVSAGQTIPGDGEVISGIATVDESAITGESAPVVRESGGDRSAVTGGTRVLSDQITVRITSKSGDSFIDRMIALVEGSVRSKTPSEISLNILLVGMSIIFVLVAASMIPILGFFNYAIAPAILAALVVTLIPTTIGGLMSAIGISGMDRLVRFNVLAMSGKSVEAAGDVDVLLLDKTGTITLGNRLASELVAYPGIAIEDLADAAQLSSLSDETPEGRSIVVLVKQKYNLRGRDLSALNYNFVPFTAQTRMSGIDMDGIVIRKGAVDAVMQHLAQYHSGVKPLLHPAFQAAVDKIAKSGGTPLLVCKGNQVMGAVHLKDVIKGGIRERFAQLRLMGIKTIMVTGDNRLTAAAIAAESGVDDFLAEASPEAKLNLIRQEQAQGKLVAMCGDGTNDAPALAQADIGVAMNTGTVAAREAGNMIDLDSDPTKLVEIVGIGKQLLMTRGSLTTFSFANDIAKYFAILPVVFADIFPPLGLLNVMRLHSMESAILSAVIFNALIILALIPVAIKGVSRKPSSAEKALRDNLLIYGVGGIMVPFAGIKIIDELLSVLGMVS